MPFLQGNRLERRSNRLSIEEGDIMEAKEIKICPKCGMAVAGNIMYCLYCRTYLPDKSNEEGARRL